MRIGMMADTYKPHTSGITNYISLNKRYLEQAGHEVFVFTFGDEDYEDDEPNIIRSPGLPLVDSGYYLSFRYSRAAKSLLQSMEVVHVHHPFLSGRLALRYCRPVGIPIIFTNHTRYDIYAHAYLPVVPEGVSETLLHTYMPDFCDAVDVVVSPSAGMANVLRDFGVNAPIRIVPNGVETQPFHQAHKHSIRTELGFGEKDLVLIYTGRLAPEKNLPFLFRAFGGLREAIPTARLLLVGGGPQEEHLRELADDANLLEHIHFAGRVNYDMLPSYLGAADIFVTPSISEVHPLSVIEAMAAGLPVMGIQSVGVGDTIQHGVSGFLASEDLPAYTALLTRLCLESGERHRMGHAARQASEKYDIHNTTRSMLDVYETLQHAGRSRKRGFRVRWQSFLENFKS